MAAFVAAVILGLACTEPWSSCSPDARWLERVLAHAGYRDVGADGAALIVPFTTAQGSRQWRFVWATPGPAAAGPRLYTVRGRTIRGDAVRIVWSVQGRQVWVEPPPPRRAVARLVAASRAVPRR